MEKEKITRIEQLEEMLSKGKSLQSILEGENSSEAYTALRNFVYSTVRKMLRTVEETEDVTQDTMLKIHLCLPEYELSKGRLVSWTATIAKRTAADLGRKIMSEERKFSISDYRTECPEKNTISKMANASPYKERDSMSASDEAIRNESNSQAREIAKFIDNSYQEGMVAFSMTKVRDISYKGTATATKKILGTIKSSVHKAGIALKEEFSKYSPEQAT